MTQYSKSKSPCARKVAYPCCPVRPDPCCPVRPDPCCPRPDPCCQNRGKQGLTGWTGPCCFLEGPGLAVGRDAGSPTQGVTASAFGERAGSVSQGLLATALGFQAGADSQAASSTAVGANSVANGAGSVVAGQGASAKGANSLVFGEFASDNAQPNTIVLNATGGALKAPPTTQGVYVTSIDNTFSQTGLDKSLSIVVPSAPYHLVYWNSETMELVAGSSTASPINVDPFPPTKPSKPFPPKPSDPVDPADPFPPAVPN